MLNDIGISEDMFAEACIKSSSNPTHKMLLSEIMAVDNFLAFKKLMLKRNRELNQEAMALMQAQEAGIDPNTLYQDGYGGYSEDDEIARAIQASLELEKKSSGASPALSEEDELMRQALEASKKEWEAEQAARRVEEPKPAKTKVEKPKATPKEPVTKASPPKSDLAPVKAPKSLAPLAAAAPVIAPAPVPEPSVAASDSHEESKSRPKQKEEKKAVSREEMKERMEKLRAQRDLLLKKKQEDLQKEWDEFGDDKKEGGDSRKDMIQKGLGSLGIKETSIKYKTEEEKQRDKDRLKEQKEKEEAGKQHFLFHSTSIFKL